MYSGIGHRWSVQFSIEGAGRWLIANGVLQWNTEIEE